MERYLEYEREADRLELIIIRPIYSIVISIVLAIYGCIAGICQSIQWIIVMITGERNEGLNDYVRQYVSFSIQVVAYTYALSDIHPELTPKRMRVFFEELEYGNHMEEYLMFELEASRLEFLIIRPIYSWILTIVLMIYACIAGICQSIQWIIVLITGERNEGLNHYVRQYVVFSMQVAAYTNALTDRHPDFGPRSVNVFLERLE